MCNRKDWKDFGCRCTACITVCGCCIGTIFLIASFFILTLSRGKIAESGPIYIGDVLGNSSALFEVNSPAVTMAQFEIYHENKIFRTSHVPPSITENLPLQHLIVSSNKGDLNYLGSYDPIYLLAESSIQYIITIEPTEMLNYSPSAACLYLFDDRTSFNNFVNSNSQVTASGHCFASNATYQYSFNITTDGVYYVAVEIRSGFVLRANVSVVRKHYNTNGLEQICDRSHTCNVTVCSTIICTDESTTYFLIQPTNTTDIHYTFSGPWLHGSTYAGFIATTVLGSLFCCCCYCLLCGIGIIAIAVCCDTNTADDNLKLDALQHRPVTASTPSRQDINNSNEHHSRSTRENNANNDSFDKDLPLSVELNEDVDPPKYRDILNQEGNTTNSVEKLEFTVQHNVTDKQQISSDKQHNSLSLHPQEVEVNEHSNTIEEDALPHRIDKQSEELESSLSGEENIPELSMTSMLPSDHNKKLDESHAPAILSAIKDIVSEWENVGLFLHIVDADLKKIKYNSKDDVDHCRKEMILLWLRRRNATRDRLIKALTEAGRNDIAHKVKKL